MAPPSGSSSPPVRRRSDMLMKERVGTVKILLVEDNNGDVDLIVDAYEEMALRPEIVIAQDGLEALLLLRGEGAHIGATPPDLILLDLNLPKRDGREVLAEIKSDA